MGWSDEGGLRRNNFDFLRFLLASVVVLSHSYCLADGVAYTEPLARLTGRRLAFGALAVNWFFLISGLLITQSWLRSKGLRDFMTKRVLRIHPAFAVMTLLTAFVFVPLGSRHLAGKPAAAAPTVAAVRASDQANPAAKLDAGDPYADAATEAGPKSTDAAAATQPKRPGILGLVYRIVILNRYEVGYTVPNNPVHPVMNGSAWTIPYEFGCYVAVAILGLTGLLARPRWLAVLFVIALGLYLAVEVAHGGPVWAQFLPRKAAGYVRQIFGEVICWPRFLAYFWAGGLFLQIRHRLPHSNWIAAGCFAVLALACAAPMGRVSPYAIHVVLPVFGTYLLFWFAFHPSIRLHHFGKHGDFSYGLYLYAYPIQQLLIMYLGLAYKPLTLLAVSLPASILAGFLSWHLVEKWFLRLKRRSTHAVAHGESRSPVRVIPAHPEPAAVAG